MHYSKMQIKNVSRETFFLLYKPKYSNIQNVLLNKNDIKRMILKMILKVCQNGRVRNITEG